MQRLTLLAEADQVPGPHVVVQAVGFDLTAGNLAVLARAIDDGDQMSGQQGLGQGVENGP